MAHEPQSPPLLMRARQACEALAVSRCHLNRLIEKGEMVPAIKLTTRSAAFGAHEVRAIVASILRGESAEARKQLVRELVALREGLTAEELGKLQQLTGPQKPLMRGPARKDGTLNKSTSLLRKVRGEDSVAA